MLLSEVRHQTDAHTQVQRSLESDRVPHAYIFHGPSGIGKELFAKGLAQLFLCEAPTTCAINGPEPDDSKPTEIRVGCGACRSCQSAKAGTHPDLHLIHRLLAREHPEPEVRKRKARFVSVDVIRHFLINRVALKPQLGRHKVFIVCEADRMNDAAQNAALKTLEEPPPNTTIILIVRSTEGLLPTTLSRCQIVRFDPLPGEFVLDSLAQLRPDLDKNLADWYAKLSGGSVGLALEHIDDNLYAINQQLMEQLESVMQGRCDGIAELWSDQAKALGELEKKRDPEISPTEASRQGLKSVLFLASAFFSDLLRASCGVSGTTVNRDTVDRFKNLAAKIHPERISDAIGRIAQTERQLDQNVNAQLCIETLLFDLVDLVNKTHSPA